MSLPGSAVRPEPWTATVVGGLLAIAVLAVFFQALTCGFVYDDGYLIVNNPIIRDWRILPSLFAFDVTEMTPYQTASGYYRPVSMAVLVVARAFFGLNPVLWHAFNLLLHFTSALLVYKTARQMLGSSPAALAGALVFAVHPAHVEAVVPVYNYMGLLAACFALASFYAWIQFRLSARRRFALISFSAFALAIFSKEDTLVLPVLIFLYDLLFQGAKKLKSTWQDFIPFVALGLMAVGMRLLFVERGASLGLWDIDNTFNLAPHFGLIGKMGAVIQVYAEYLRMMVWPRALTPFHSLPVFSLSDLSAWFQILSWAVWLGGTWLLRREKVLLFSSLWFGTTLFLVSNLIPIGGLFAERLAYLPSVAYGWVIAWAVAGLLQCGKKRIAVATVTLICLFYAVRVWAAVPVWKNDVTLWRHAAAQTPDRPLPRLNLAEAYFAWGDYQSAATEYNLFLKFPQKPAKEAMARHKLSRCLGEMGLYDAAALELQKTIMLTPWSGQAYFDLGWTYLLQKRYPEARQNFELMLRFMPENPWGYFGLAEIAEREEKTLESRQFYAETLNRAADPGMRETILKKLRENT